MKANYQIIQGDCIERLKEMPSESVHCCVTSPPYFMLRDYGVEGQIGLEPTPAEFVATMVTVFNEVRRVLKDDGTLWLNLGDSYWGSGKGLNPDGTHSSINTPTDKQFTNKGALKTKVGKYSSDLGLKPKDLIGIPWRVALALQEAGWWLRQDIIWSKPNPMPESVTDRCTKSHEYIFLLTKSAKYYYNTEAIREKSVTQDIRRPYGSLGAWDIDGRPDEQRHGGEPRSFKGLNFNTGKTAEHQLNRASSRDRTVGNRNGEGASTLDNERPKPEQRNKRSVWTVSTTPYKEAHFATFPEKLIEPCILAGSREGDTVLDPFAGAGTTLLVSKRLGRNSIGIELNPEYIKMIEHRLAHWHKASPPPVAKDSADLPLFMEIGA